MKASGLLLTALLSICAVSCRIAGGPVKPVAKKVNGPLGRYYEVVDREYSIRKGRLAVEFKRIAQGGPKDASWVTTPGFALELLDKDGNVIRTDNTDVVSDQGELNKIFALGVGESASVTFRFDKVIGASRFKVSSVWDGDEPAAPAAPAVSDAGSDYDVPPVQDDIDDTDYSWLAERLVNDNDLRSLDKTGLRILRNTIYARHGYIFSSEDLRDYFEHFTWYVPRSKDVTGELNDIEKRNIETIQRYEKTAR